MKVVLAVSILLNLFLVAVIGGHVIHARNRGDTMGMPLARAMLRAQAILPRKDAMAFGAVIRRDAPRFGGSWEKLRDTRQELDRQIGAEPFDPAATRQALKATQLAWDRFLDQFGDTLVDGLTQISSEGRHKLLNETALSAPLPPQK
jgi:uncharacterized membrane protein